MLVGLGLVLVGISAVVANRVIAAEEEVGNLIAALPSWAHETFAIGFGLAALFVLWILISALVAKRGDMLRDLLLAGAIAVVVGLLLARLIVDAWPIVFPELGDAAPAPRFPVLRVAVVSAIVAAAGPHLTRPIRRLGWASVILVAVSGLGLGLGLPSDDVGGVGSGIAAAGAVFLLFGSPAGYPDPEQVTAELAGLGLVVTNLHPTPNQTWGTRTLVGEDEEGLTFGGSEARTRSNDLNAVGSSMTCTSSSTRITSSSDSPRAITTSSTTRSISTNPPP